MDTISEKPKEASPQVEDGHLKIAHEIAEAFSKTKISGNDWRVLWVIIRKTYGWHKKMDCISTTQFQKETGLKRWHVSRALNNLTERCIITKNGDSFITSYGLQKDYTQWKTVTQNGDKPQTVTKKVSKLSPKMVNTKATTKALKNGRPKKKRPDPGISEFFKFWDETFQRETGQPYAFTGGKEGSLIKDLLQIHSLETLQDLAGQFFKDKQVKEKIQAGKIGYTIGTFKLEVNRFVTINAMDPLEQAKREITGRG